MPSLLNLSLMREPLNWLIVGGVWFLTLALVSIIFPPDDN